MEVFKGLGLWMRPRVHLCFCLWTHELKDPHDLRASRGYSVVEWRTKQTEVGRREWVANRKEQKEGRENGEAMRHCLNAWFTLYVYLTFQ